jgi:hypothetical protein
VPKRHWTPALAQVRGFPSGVCKSPTTVFPGSNPGPAAKNRRSSPVHAPGQAIGGSGAGRRRRGLRGRKNHPAAASSKLPGDQPGCESTRSGPPMQGGGEPRRSGSCAKYASKDFPCGGSRGRPRGMRAGMSRGGQGRRSGHSGVVHVFPHPGAHVDLEPVGQQQPVQGIH